MISPARGAMAKRGMETLREALERLENRNFKESLLPRPGGMLARSGAGAVAPESLVIEEVVRFEGESDPGDEAVLFALRSQDEKIRGTFVASYGAYTEPDSAAVIRRLDNGTSPDGTESSRE